MIPVIEHLKETLEITLHADSHFYSKIITLHQELALEYSILGQQLRNNLLSQLPGKEDQITEELIAALMLSELLEHVYEYYLIVPREVVRLRKHQRIYRERLAQKGFIFPDHLTKSQPINVGLSLSWKIREETIEATWYLHLFIRVRRTLDLIDIFGTGSAGYHHFVNIMNQFANPLLSYLGWCFYLPRLLVNLFLLIKHTTPGFWMNEKERSIDWSIRFKAQIQRRWFELANDIVKVLLGLINCFVLTGALAPIGIYLTIIFFGYDVIVSAYRTYLELNRLDKLQQYYKLMQNRTMIKEDKQEIEDYLTAIKCQTHFEKLRLGLHIANAAGIFLAMCLAAPAFSMMPIIPLIGTIMLLIVWVAAYTLTKNLIKDRPNDTIEKPSGVRNLSFFAKKTEIPFQSEPAGATESSTRLLNKKYF